LSDWNSAVAPLIMKLERVFALSADERQAILSLPARMTDIKADQDIVRLGDRPSRSCFILDGMACTYKISGEGKRQIVNFHIPGDVPDLQSIYLGVLDVSIGTITPCRVGFVPHEAMRELCAKYSRIAGALWRETLIDAAIFREWITNVGQRPAPSRIAHLMCEFVARFRVVGLADGNTIQFPITQSEIGDATGLSNVHVNRSIQALRKQGLISLQDSTLMVLDWERLCEFADFDPIYLHLRDETLAVAG
jgi:CRP-like cAMP-binding protein